MLLSNNESESQNGKRFVLSKEGEKTTENPASLVTALGDEPTVTEIMLTVTECLETINKHELEQIQTTEEHLLLKKSSSTNQLLEIENTRPKRGRPRKAQNIDVNINKHEVSIQKPKGRPRKTESAEVAIQKPHGKRGRPRKTESN